MHHLITFIHAIRGFKIYGTVASLGSEALATMCQPSRKKIDPRAPVSNPPTPRQETYCTGLLPGFGRIRMSPPGYNTQRGYAPRARRTYQVQCDGRTRHGLRLQAAPISNNLHTPYQSYNPPTRQSTNRIIPQHTDQTILAYRSDNLRISVKFLTPQSHNPRTQQPDSSCTAIG